MKDLVQIFSESNRRSQPKLNPKRPKKYPIPRMWVGSKEVLFILDEPLDSDRF